MKSPLAGLIKERRRSCGADEERGIPGHRSDGFTVSAQRFFGSLFYLQSVFIFDPPELSAEGRGEQEEIEGV